MDNGHLNSFESGVLVPGAQAVITGVLLGVSGFSLAWLLKFDVWVFLTLGVTVGTLLSWLLFRNQWLKAFHSLAGVLDVPPLQEPTQEQDYTRAYTLRVPIITENRKEGVYATLPASVEQLRKLGEGMLRQGATLSESQWCGGGRPFSRKEFSALRAELVARGLAYWKSPRDTARGVELTPAGKACMKYFSTLTPSDVTPYPTG